MEKRDRSFAPSNSKQDSKPGTLRTGRPESGARPLFWRKKGFYGRLKLGIDPRPAVVGYLDQGAGKPKLPDPVKAPLIRLVFPVAANIGEVRRGC